MLIRGYRPSDQEAVERITKEAWRGVTIAEIREQHFGIIGEPWADQKAKAILSKCNAHPERAVVAETEGQVVGYATFSFALGGEIGAVTDNAVDPAWQGRGIGTKLITHVVEILKSSGVKMLEVQTFEHDTPARRVYERVGFQEVAKTVHYMMRPGK